MKINSATPPLYVHGGNWNTTVKDLGLEDCPPLRLDFSVNLNPLGMPPAVEAHLQNAPLPWDRYPEPYGDEAIKALAAAHGVASSQVLVGNGSTELFALVLRVLKPDKVSWINPCYFGYEEVTRALGMAGEPTASAKEANDFALDLDRVHLSRNELLFLASPNNPTGRLLDPMAVVEKAKCNPLTWFIIDESYLDFLGSGVSASLMNRIMPENIVVIKSFTKFFCLPGLRFGMLCASPQLTTVLKNGLLPWSVNVAALSTAPMLYQDQEFLQKSCVSMKMWREALSQDLAVLDGLKVFPSSANFLYLKLPVSCPSRKLQKELLRSGILIRVFGDSGSAKTPYVRVSVRRPEENADLVRCIESVLLNGKAAKKPDDRKSTHAIMVLGTMSHSGKSTVAAALCRYAARKGRKVAPFKAQNMSLNSFVTPEGGEIGRAQAVQARAAGVEPHTNMNPVLLKPTGGGLMQIVLSGKAVENMSAKEYYARKQDFRLVACKAYDALAERFDTLILEGAGSPAEINLRHEDFVNASMAEYASARCVLVADIDRGGVFASILGTVKLLLEHQRKMIAGIIINKFRGDVSLLVPGIKEIESLTGIPVLGVLPFLEDLRLEEEDSLGLEGRSLSAPALLDLVVIRLPHISNFTDFQPLENMAGSSLRYVSGPEQLGNPDLILIPGTKSVIRDLEFLKKSGLERSLLAAARRQIPIFGICGGYQILGRIVKDPLGLEGEPGETQGLNLLPVETLLEKEKELCRVEAENISLPFLPNRALLSGYEIHMGRTRSVEENRPLVRTLRKNGLNLIETGGTYASGAPIWGCYLHGLFDSLTVREGLAKWLGERKGLEWKSTETEYDKNRADDFDRLADAIDKHLNLSLLFPKD